MSRRAKLFIRRALAPLGYTLAFEDFSDSTGELAIAGFSAASKCDFILRKETTRTVAIHVAFVATDRSQADEFYKAAMASGGRDNGAPALCPEYHAGYYGGFVLDPDGHNIEAVCHEERGRAQ
ncbi:MAG TPA: VOC family protein [Terrimicrobiaceae bacterium]